MDMMIVELLRRVIVRCCVVLHHFASHTSVHVSDYDDRAPPPRDDRYAPPPRDDRYAPPPRDDRYAPPPRDDRYAPPPRDDYRGGCMLVLYGSLRSF